MEISLIPLIMILDVYFEYFVHFIIFKFLCINVINILSLINKQKHNFISIKKNIIFLLHISRSYIYCYKLFQYHEKGQQKKKRLKKTPISTNLEQGGKPDSCSALFNVYTYFSFFAAQRRGEGVRLCPLLRTASSSRSKNLRQRRPPWRKLSEHTFRISRPMFPSGPRYIVITKRLALREGYDSLSLRLCLRFCLPRQNISTIRFFISGFCSNPFSFLLLLFPEIIVAFLPNSLLSLRVNHYSVPFFLFLLFFSNIQFCARRYIWVSQI